MTTLGTGGGAGRTDRNGDDAPGGTGAGLRRGPGTQHDFNRYELKYLVPVEQVGDVRAELTARMDADRNAADNGYGVWSLYCRDRDFDIRSEAESRYIVSLRFAVMEVKTDERTPAGSPTWPPGTSCRCSTSPSTARASRRSARRPARSSTCPRRIRSPSRGRAPPRSRGSCEHPPPRCGTPSVNPIRPAAS
ncbi:hypothetical protein GCM10023405_45810 [Streptomonospora salina]